MNHFVDAELSNCIAFARSEINMQIKLSADAHLMERASITYVKNLFKDNCASTPIYTAVNAVYLQSVTYVHSVMISYATY